jgi:hypothetical protein
MSRGLIPVVPALAALAACGDEDDDIAGKPGAVDAAPPNDAGGTGDAGATAGGGA